MQSGGVQVELTSIGRSHKMRNRNNSFSSVTSEGTENFYERTKGWERERERKPTSCINLEENEKKRNRYRLKEISKKQQQQIIASVSEA